MSSNAARMPYVLSIHHALLRIISYVRIVVSGRLISRSRLQALMALQATTCLLVGFCGTVHGQTDKSFICPNFSADIKKSNLAAIELFKQRVLDPVAVGQAPTSKPNDYVEALAAVGDGVADDTQALQSALDKGRKVWLKSSGVYRITRRLELRDGTAMASDGTATLLMAAGADGFGNRVAQRGDDGLYSERGTGLRLLGNNITVSDIFIVKIYEDDTYVIGIDIRESSHVLIRRVRMRGFALGPGIVTIRSSDDIEVTGSLIHSACTRSTKVPQDLRIFQITGISVDNSRVEHRDSAKIRLNNNVISDLRMVPVTARHEQTDGINFSGIGTGQGSDLHGNDIRNVDEGMDLFGSGIQVVGNHIEAHGRPLKLVHGANNITVSENTLIPGPGGNAIAIFTANPPEAQRQVRDIVIERNTLMVTAGQDAGIRVDANGEFPPKRITLNANTLVVTQCKQRVIACAVEQCARQSNVLKQSKGGASCGN